MRFFYDIGIDFGFGAKKVFDIQQTKENKSIGQCSQ